MIAPVFEEYKAISAQIKELEDAQAAGPPAPAGGGEDLALLSVDQLETRKVSLRAEIKRMQLENAPAEQTAMIYDVYLRVKQAIEARAGGSAQAAGPPPATPLPTRSQVSATSIPPIEQLNAWKEEAKRRVRDAKTASPAEAEAARPVYDLYVALKADIESYPNITETWKRAAVLLGGGAGAAAAPPTPVAAAVAAMVTSPPVRPVLSQAAAAEKGEALWQAAEKGDPVHVQDLVRQGAPLEVRLQHGMTPLMVAASLGRFGVCKVLLEAGANVDALHEAAPVNALYMAVQRGHAEVVRLLLDAGASPHQAAYPGGVTPLWVAAHAGEAGCMRELLARKPNVNAQSADGVSPLSIAVERSMLQVARLLVEAGADVESPDREGFTCLAVAAQSQNLALVQLLLRAGARVGARTREGDTAVEIAASCGFRPIVDALMEAGAVAGPAVAELERY